MFWGQGADQGTVGVGTVDEEVVSAAFDTVGKGDSRRRARRPGEGNDPPLGCELSLSENDQGMLLGFANRHTTSCGYRRSTRPPSGGSTSSFDEMPPRDVKSGLAGLA